MHKSANTTPFRVVLSQHPPGQTTVPQPSAASRDSYVDTDPRWLSLNLQRKSGQYKYNYHVILYTGIEFVPNQCVAAYKLSLTDKANIADQMKRASYIKLKTKTFGPFQIIIKVQSLKVVLNEERAPNFVSMHRVTVAPGLREHHSKTSKLRSLVKNKTRTTMQQ